MSVFLVFLILALVCFLAATPNPGWPRVNLVALGLAFLVVGFLLRASG